MDPLRRCLLVLILSLAFSPKSFGQAPDCEKASVDCTQQCGQLAVYDRDREGYLTHSDFQERCERSCAAGLKSCQGEESDNSCSVFSYHCTDACPWTVYEAENQLNVTMSDAFNQCRNACSTGSLGCYDVAKTMKPRKRTAKFEPCAEAQGECYADCADYPTDPDAGKINDSNLPDTCAAACAKAVPACQRAGEEDKCTAYFNDCSQRCPTAITREDGTVLENTDANKVCQTACRQGKMACQSILHQMIDTDDVDDRDDADRM